MTGDDPRMLVITPEQRRALAKRIEFFQQTIAQLRGIGKLDIDLGGVHA